MDNNRRSFLKMLPALPIAAKAAMEPEPEAVPEPTQTRDYDFPMGYSCTTTMCPATWTARVDPLEGDGDE